MFKWQLHGWKSAQSLGLGVVIGTILLWTQHSGRAVPPESQTARYENYRNPKGPWSVHIIRVPRRDQRFEIQSVHARKKALGLGRVSEQVALASELNWGVPVAAINGDYYERGGTYAGDPRGLQIVDGEIISAPSGSASFWVDALDEPHATETFSAFQVHWPNGSRSLTGLNGYREANGIQLYTPALGSSTGTTGGREFVLERLGENPWLPLRPGRSYRARIREIRDRGNSELLSDTMVLSIGPRMRAMAQISVGSEIMILTGTNPNLRGAKTAISGGPILIRNGKRERIQAPKSDSYEFSTMLERHPRSAIGWNRDYFFLVQVDGRQRGGSVGMTLDEFAAYLVSLGCEQAMNLDGGGSTTVWYEGKIRNFLCDGYEREIANCLIAVQKGSIGLRQRSLEQTASDAP
jgi:hypothetical protein